MNIPDWPSGPAFVGLVADHAWQSTLVAGAAAVLALLFKHRPSVRYWIWFAAAVKFVVPFAALMAIGHLVEWTPPVLVRAEAATRLVETVSQPFSDQILGRVELLAARPVEPHHTVWPQVVLTIWTVGVVFLLVRWHRRWRHLARIAAAARPSTGGRESSALSRAQASAAVASPLRIACTDIVMEPGVFGIVRPVLLWPHDVSQHLDDEQMDAIILHEICHVKRRDNVMAVAIMFVEAMFWFHPMVWWLGTRFVDDRERACDDDVIRLGVEPSIYAEGLLNTCRFCLESPLACVPGVTGADLRKRIEGIMQAKVVTRLNGWKRVVLGSAAAAVVAAPIVVGAIGKSGASWTPLLTSHAITSWLQQPSLLPSSFEQPRTSIDTSGTNAATTQFAGAPAAAAQTPVNAPPKSIVKASLITPPIAPVWFTISPDGRTIAGAGLTLREAIRFAYAGSNGPLAKGQSTGGPAWLDSVRFDIIASSADGSSVTLVRNANGAVVGGTGLPLLQQVLANRFRLALHVASQSTPVFDLIGLSGAPGVDLRKSIERCDNALIPCGFRSGPGFIAARGVTMEQLAGHLASSFPAINRPVRDKTGLTGNFDITMSFTPAFLWSPQTGEPNVANPNASTGLSLFAALEERLGLRLLEQVDALDIAVVDSAESPRLD